MGAPAVGQAVQSRPMPLQKPDITSSVQHTMSPQLGAVQQPMNLQQSIVQGLQQAGQTFAQGTQYQPQQITPTGFQAAQTGQVAPLQAQQVQAGQLGTTSLSPYMNPYESQVVGQALSDLERSRQMQQNLLGAQATQARAFGGSRQGIAEAETNRAFAEQAARTAGQLRQAGFGQAQAAAQQDIASRMQAAIANQQAGLQAGMTSAQLQQQANLQNQQAQQQAAQFGAQQGMTAQQLNQMAGLQGAQQRMGAAGQLAGLAGTGYNIYKDIGATMAQQGAQQRALEQALYDQAMQQYQGFMGAPAASAGMLTGALPNIRTGEMTQTNTYRPSTLQTAISIANIARGLPTGNVDPTNQAISGIDSTMQPINYNIAPQGGNPLQPYNPYASPYNLSQSGFGASPWQYGQPIGLF